VGSCNFSHECQSRHFHVHLSVVTYLSVPRLKTDDSIVTDAIVRYDGSVTWIRPIVYTVTSRHEFRGNSWSAMLKFASWTYGAALLDLQPLPADFTRIPEVSSSTAFLPPSPQQIPESHGESLRMMCILSWSTDCPRPQQISEISNDFSGLSCDKTRSTDPPRFHRLSLYLDDWNLETILIAFPGTNFQDFQRLSRTSVVK